MSETCLIARDVSMSLSGHERRFCLRVPNFALKRGQARALTGESGSGKTLFLETLALLRACDPGSKLLLKQDGVAHDLTLLWQPAAAVDLQYMRARLYGVVPQIGGLLPALSARENILLPQRIIGALDHGFADHLMQRLGLETLATALPQDLSIGQRQRVAIARAFAHKPTFVIADEPTAALDPDLSTAVLTLLLKLVKTHKVGLLLSSHDQAALVQVGIPAVRVRPAAEASPQEIEMMVPDDTEQPLVADTFPS